MGSCGGITEVIRVWGQHLWVQEEHPAVSIPWVHWEGGQAKTREDTVMAVM